MCLSFDLAVVEHGEVSIPYAMFSFMMQYGDCLLSTASIVEGMWVYIYVVNSKKNYLVPLIRHALSANVILISLVKSVSGGNLIHTTIYNVIVASPANTIINSVLSDVSVI